MRCEFGQTQWPRDREREGERERGRGERGLSEGLLTSADKEKQGFSYDRLNGSELLRHSGLWPYFLLLSSIILQGGHLLDGKPR